MSEEKYNFQLPFKSKEEIEEYAKRYDYKDDEEAMQIAREAKERGYLEKNEFVKLCYWKSQRPIKRYKENEEQFIAEVTTICFQKSTSDELRIKILETLNGVSLRVASALLHLAFLYDVKQGYPIMDVWALRALGVDRVGAETSNSFELWSRYLAYCRDKRRLFKVDMRTLDRALWAYGKEKYGKR